MAHRYTPIDARTTFCEGKTLTASAVVKTNDDGATAMDIGPGRHDFTLVVDITALDIASANELVTFVLRGSANADMSDPQQLAILQVGATASRLGGAIDSVIGRYLVEAANEAPMGTEWEYVDLDVIVSGTTPSVTFSAYLSLDI